LALESDVPVHRARRDASIGGRHGQADRELLARLWSVRGRVDAVPGELLSRAKALYDQRAGDQRSGPSSIDGISIVWD